MPDRAAHDGGVPGSTGPDPVHPVTGSSDLRHGLVDAAEIEELGEALADIVTQTSGVLRIEPTLRGAVQAWRSREGDDPAQHLELTVRGRIVDVGVHVAVTTDQQARLLAHRLRERLRAHLTGRGLEPGSVEISILVIEPTTS